MAGKGGPGLEAVAEHLPESDAKRPHVRGGREPQVVDALRCTPEHGSVCCYCYYKRGVMQAVVDAHLSTVQSVVTIIINEE